MDIIWKDEYSVGIKEIDDQHKYFISLLNDLNSAIVAAKNREELESLFQTLSDYAEKHFATEEKYFDEFGYEGAAEHKQKHREMRDQIEEMRKTKSGQEIDFFGNLVYFLQDWLENHLKTVDQKYKDCFREHGLK